jgi:hypothetical protein
MDDRKWIMDDRLIPYPFSVISQEKPGSCQKQLPGAVG